MRARSALFLGLVLLGPGLVAPARAERRPAAPPSSRRTPPPARLDFASFDALPLDFEENRGQCDPAARFLARGRGFLAFLTDEGAVFACAAGPGPDRHARPGAPLPGFDPDVVRMRFPGSAAGAPRAGGDRRPGVSNYLVGRDGSRQAVGVRRWGEVLRPGLWPGIDLLWRGGARRSLEYRFHVAAGADPSRIALAFDGAVPRLGPDGDLLLDTPRGVLRHGRPSAWQDGETGPTPVDVAFRLRPDGGAGFSLGAHDAARPLVIDPQVAFAHLRGGSGEDEAWGIASDPQGYVYVSGWAASANFPLQGPFQSSHGGGAYDAFVLKLGVRGIGTVYATYLGGSDSDLAYGLAVDAAGAAHVVGGTSSPDFPTASAYQAETLTGNETGFVARLAPDGASLSWSTYLGGSVLDSVRHVALGPGGDVYLAGGTSSPDFPVAGAAQASPGGAFDAFVARMAVGGGSLAWSTFLGGGEIDEARAVALGADGTVFVAGLTESVDFPDKAALQTTLGGPRDAFAAALAADGSSVSWATYLGGGGSEEGWGLAIDATGHPWVVGYTTSPDFPLQAPLDSVYEGQFEAFAVKFAADGSERILSTFLGGNQEDKAEAAAADGAGVVYVVGRTASTNFPIVQAVDKYYGGGDFDAFVTAISPSTTQIFWSTFYGGSGTDYAMAAAVDPFGAVLFAGRVDSSSGEALAASIIAVPLPPPSVVATLVGLNRIRVNWADQGTTETGYVVERRVAGGEWEQAAVLGENVTQWYDTNLLWATTYEYRVYSVNGYGESARSMVASATTRPMPTAVPAAPTDLVVQSVTAAGVRLAWTLHSDDEDAVVVDRYKEFFGFLPVRYLDMDASGWTDKDVLPMRTYLYRVRATNFLGTSAATNEVSAVVPPSFEAAVVSGKRKARDGERKDSIVLSGTATRTNNVTAWRSLDPRPVAVEMYLGDDPAALFSIPAGYAGWKEKRGAWVLKYPYYPRGKLTLTFHPTERTWSVVLKKADLPELIDFTERARLLFGDDGTEFDLPWVPVRRDGDAKIAE